MDVEIIGYISTVINLTSFTISDIKKLRIMNIVGGLGWTSYGIIVGAESIIVGNIIAVLIHLYKLYKEQKRL